MRHLVLSGMLFLYAAICGHAAVTVYVDDVAPENCRDYTPVVQDILDSHPEGNVRIVFSGREYHFHRTYAKGRYHEITNHDNGYKYFAFMLENMKNVEIDGNGAEFIFHGVMTPVLIENSENITIRNLAIDWEEPFFIQGTVIRSYPEEKAADIEFTGFSRIQPEGNRLNIVSNDNEMYFLGESMVFDPATGAVAYNAHASTIGGTRGRTAECVRISGNTYRVKAEFAKKPAGEGLVYVFKGPNGSNRLAPAIHAKSSSDISMEDVTIHHAGGMGFIAEKSEDIHLDNVDVRLRDGTDRMVTTTADATHFCNCRGKVIIENCLFENMLDDAANVHGTYLKVDRILSGNKVLAKLNHRQQFGYDFADAGDRIRIVDAVSILPKAEVSVTSYRQINEVYAEISFSDDIKDDIAVGDGLENISWYPELYFRNNIVRNNRARSILVSTGNKAVIEGNTFSSMMTSILFEGDLNHWHESGAVNSVIIRNNKFLDCCYGGNNAFVIWINPRVSKMPEDKYFEKNITIEDNIFNSFDRPVVYAKSVDGLIFRNNSITPSGTYPQLRPDMPEFDIEHCRNIIFSGNRYNGDSQAEIKIDSKSEKSADFRKNSGFADICTD